MTIQKKMQQVQFSTYGTTEVLSLQQVDCPQPQAGQVLIKNEAIGVNYSDILRRKNTYFMPTPLPYVLGSEAVGQIEVAGEGVNAPLQKGSRVLAILPYGGAYAEYVLADARYCIPLPPEIPAAEATGIFVQGSTAWLMLHKLIGKLEGKTVLVHAAAGGVGSLLVQLAKLAGAKVIATASSATKLETARELGADAGVNYTETGWPEAVIAANGGEKVDYILEMVGGDIYEQSFDCLATGGTMIVYGAASGKKGMIHSEKFVDEGHNLLSFNLAHYSSQHFQDWQEGLTAMIGLLAQGKIKVHIGQTFPLSEAATAHQQIENRQTTGKVVLLP